jgi:hypothetical protein
MNTRIKIIKRNAGDEDKSNRAVDSTKAQPGENRTRDVVNTVKSWIVEMNERKRIQSHSFAPLPVTKISAMLILLLIAANTARISSAQGESQRQDLRVTAKSQTAPQVTIAVGPEIGMAKDVFKVGEAILVTITMTNSSMEPQNVCLSANLYQNLPVLTKNDAPVAITKWTSEAEMGTS